MSGRRFANQVEHQFFHDNSIPHPRSSNHEFSSHIEHQLSSKHSVKHDFEADEQRSFDLAKGTNIIDTVDANYPVFSRGAGINPQDQMYNQYCVPRFDTQANASSSATASRHNRKMRQAAKQSTQKRKLEASDDDGSDSEDDGYPLIPGQLSAVQIARQKYNHIEDEKERKRLKRLLRNRVSAQQARERKKAYMSTLESRSKELEDRAKELDQRVNTLERENFMLRQVIKNITNSAGKTEES
eukprot:CAMPEP_0196598190 /NCGR_PEP_ID=MMETSP1081-20130531/94180_1 /TAXON_ID=36882 /ORGANISM="Pyramimonas amylifera, Strain CCMP720" /LENGTH=241 /DNA_ID=CAMNT_0041923855 /DNA_START=776 /DNA_END=1501 /DNA_ORIENTATION=-